MYTHDTWLHMGMSKLSESRPKMDCFILHTQFLGADKGTPMAGPITTLYCWFMFRYIPLIPNMMFLWYPHIYTLIFGWQIHDVQ